MQKLVFRLRVLLATRDGRGHTLSMTKLSPWYGTASCALAYFFSVALVWNQVGGPFSRSSSGPGPLAAGILGGFVFLIAFIISFMVFGLILRILRGDGARLTFIGISAAAILAWHGMPGWIASICGIVLLCYIQSQGVKMDREARALEQFEQHGP